MSNNSSSEHLKYTKHGHSSQESIGAACQYEIPAPQLGAICGANDGNLRTMSALFGDRVYCLGNRLSLRSADPALQQLFGTFLGKVLSYMEQGIEAQPDLLDALFYDCQDELSTPNGGAAAGKTAYNPAGSAIALAGKKVLPRNRRQHELLRMFAHNEVILALGPAGTGKTYLAVAYGLEQLLGGSTSLLLLSRPVVEAGESLGFLPGDFAQKISPYMQPLFDAMRSLLRAEQIAALEAKNMLEVAPLAYMRGRSLHNAIVILDEAQNATPEQVKMLLTRLGEDSKAILTGDPTQSDLGIAPNSKSAPPPTANAGSSGLCCAAAILAGVKGVAVQRFSNQDVVRSALVRRIIRAYEQVPPGQASLPAEEAGSR